ncbi:hypothetical protein INS49_005435 [Diaporthe citri]|uniref:uncharacterized protein n=1 Tax=Diaporthe citri TaxID=83186 RepID=UPI001C82361A|nr:uncharacterized protein INS49_005435 [Diaporthe citri]KAG6353726.1 hypothetical protein INS49_005435 [Diaporthe citri]
MKFGFKTDVVGSVGYSGQPAGDSFAFYPTGGIGQGGCGYLGYLYHQRTGLCVAVAFPTSLSSPRYTNAPVTLQRCGSFSSAPPETQSFCGLKFLMQNGDYWVGVLFKGDYSNTAGHYGSRHWWQRQ